MYLCAEFIKPIHAEVLFAMREWNIRGRKHSAHGPEVVGSNPGCVELRVYSSS